MADREIIRIAISPAAKQVIEAWAAAHDMTEMGIASRIYEWFGQQPEDLQRGILGMYGDRTALITRMALEALENNPPDTSAAAEFLAKVKYRKPTRRRGRKRSRRPGGEAA